MFIAPLPPPFISIKESPTPEFPFFQKDSISGSEDSPFEKEDQEEDEDVDPHCGQEDISQSLSTDILRSRLGSDLTPSSLDNVGRFSYQLRNSNKARSSDLLLERLESSRLRSFKISEIERGLYMGNYESANDVLLLESKRITHILTIDSVPLPRRILCILPKVVNLHLRVSDLPEEDILAHIAQIQEFISVKEDSSGTYNVLVHCYRGKSRSAAAVISYLMAKYSLPMEVGLSRVKRQRRLVNPNQSFLSQLKLFENMNWSIQRSNLQFRMFKLVMVSEKMRKAKILFRDSLDSILDPLLMGGDALPSVIYKCKSCRITLASSLHLLPHLVDESPSWTDSSWSAHSQDELASSFLYRSCSASVFINPIKWMEADIKNKLCGSLKCPNCRIVVGGFSWIKGESCYSCKAVIRPAFRLDITEIIFRTKCKFLQSSNREPILV